MRFRNDERRGKCDLLSEKYADEGSNETTFSESFSLSDASPVEGPKLNPNVLSDSPSIDEADCDPFNESFAKSYAHAFSLADTSSLPCSLDIAVTRPYENADEEAHKSPLSFPDSKSYARAHKDADEIAVARTYEGALSLPDDIPHCRTHVRQQLHERRRRWRRVLRCQIREQLQMLPYLKWGDGGRQLGVVLPQLRNRHAPDRMYWNRT